MLENFISNIATKKKENHFFIKSFLIFFSCKSKEYITGKRINQTENELTRSQHLNEDLLENKILQNNDKILTSSLSSNSSIKNVNKNDFSLDIVNNNNSNNKNNNYLAEFKIDQAYLNEKNTKKKHKNLNIRDRNLVLRKEKPLNMDDDKAAVRIQSTFRGYKTRKHLKSDNKSLSLDMANIDLNSKKRVKSQSSQHKETNPEELAATKIQSTFRGYKTRKDLEGKTKQNRTPRKNLSPIQQN